MVGNTFHTGYNLVYMCVYVHMHKELCCREHMQFLIPRLAWAQVLEIGLDQAQ